MNQQTTPLAVPIIGFALFLAVGVLCTFYAEIVQRHATSDWSRKLSPVMQVPFLRRHLLSKAYIWELRVIGVLSLAAAAVILYSLLAWPPRVSS